MSHCHRLFVGLVLLVLFVPGCGEPAPVAVENPAPNFTSVNPVVEPTATTPKLAPILPGTRNADAPPTPARPSRKGLTALDSPTHDFGEVRQNTQLRHDFVLTNNVDVPIRIVKMASSCSCTWSESNDKIMEADIAPGQKIDYPLFLNTGTLQDKASGEISIIYRYQSDDPKWQGEEGLILKVSGTILPDYRIEPLDLRFGEIQAIETQTAKRSFRVTPVQMETLEIIDVKPSSSLFVANILSSGKEGYEIEVTFDGSSLANSEKVHGHLVINTNSKTVPNGLVTLSASYVTPISIAPSFLLISSDKEGTIQEEVRIVSSVPSQVRSVSRSSTGLVRAEYDSVLKSDEHLIAFSVDPCYNAAIDETISIEMVLFPVGRESIIQTVPVTIYRFHKGE